MINIITKIIIVTSLSIFLISGGILYFGYLMAEGQISDIAQQKESQGKLIATAIERKFDGMIKILEITSLDERFLEPKDPTNILPELKGVSQRSEEGLRRIGQNILDKHPEFDNVGFTLPNGDMYFVEPYPLQLQLENINFAFRDWYKGVVRTNSPYLSGVFSAESTGEKTVKVAVPVNDGNKIVGIWGGILNLGFLDIDLYRFSLNPDQLIMLYDHNGNIVSNTFTTDSDMHGEIYYDYVAKALTGNSGYEIENIADKKFFISYHPIKTGSLFWGLLTIEPYDVAFASIDAFRDQIFLMTGVVTIIGVAAATLRIYFVKQDIKKTIKLQNENKQLRNTIKKLDGKYKSLEEESLHGIPKHAQLKANHYLAAIAFSLIFIVMLNAYIYYEDRITERDFALLREPLHTGYVIQNLRGDTVDTWLSWRLLGSSVLTVNIMNPDMVTPEKLAAIKDAVSSKEVIALDDSLLHKGPKGSVSVYYDGWVGALKSIKDKETQYFIPHDIRMIESSRGEGDVIIKLTSDASGDGYSGFTKSISDESQILKSTITIYNVDRISADELKTITRHEFGHAIGLAHSTAPEDLMAPIIQTDYPYISQCDLDALVSLYNGSKESQVVCEK